MLEKEEGGYSIEDGEIFVKIGRLKKIVWLLRDEGLGDVCGVMDFAPIGRGRV